MTKINDGGPAFPPMHNPATHASGMSLRDWFAGQAVKGFLSNPTLENLDCGKKHEDALAEAAYIIADAMLAARRQSQ